MFNRGGRGLTRPDVDVELKDSLELDEDGLKPILGNGGGEFWTARYWELGTGAMGELCIRGPPGVLGVL